MSKHRMIDTKFWSDSYVNKLDPTEKLLFLYLLTNERTNVAGIYELPIKFMAVETGIEASMIEKVLTRFVKDEKLNMVEDWVCLRNFAKHQNILSPKIKKGIELVIETIPPHIRDTLCIGYVYGMHTISHSNSNSNSKANTKSLDLNELKPKPTIAPAEHQTFFKQPTSRSKKNVLQEARELCEFFTKHNGGMYNTGLHLQAAVGMLEMHSKETVYEVAEFALTMPKKEFRVEVRTPIQLADKWAKVVELMQMPAEERDKKVFF